MITKIQLHKKATVLAADGKQLGSLARVVINPNNNVITDVVVRTGTLVNHEEKVVPIALVVETADQKILLREEAGDLQAFPQFEEERIVNEHGGLNKSSSPANIPAVDNLAVGAPLLQTPKEPIVTRIEQNIPEGTVAMKEGAKVIAADGSQVGNVERVVAEPQMEQITHLLVSSGWLNKENKLIPVAWIMRMGEDTVHLRVGKDSVDDLAATEAAG